MKESSDKLYWKETPYWKQRSNEYKLRCPKCSRAFIMPKAWGVWKGCPICWIPLSYRKEKEE